MRDEIQNLRKADFAVSDGLNGAERHWVIDQLVAQNGVSGALWHADRPSHLSVEYDANVLSGDELWGLLDLYGLHARPALAAPAV